MMFMRLRGHTCNYCNTIDKAHHDRHRRLAQQLRQIYEIVGEAEWTIIPTDVVAFPLDDTMARPGDAQISKRERKDAKNLVRATNRTKVVTLEETLYIDSILHVTDGLLVGESTGPDNPEEIEEIERHLKYNAHVYHNIHDGSDFRLFSQLPDVDIDFDSEIKRTLQSLRITDLVRRNTRTRGLQGKSLKIFNKLIEEFTKAVVDDLVRVKMDVMEIRMRRAGYLRYTNKTGFNIIENRYTDKDWRTGQKHTSNSSDYSDFASTGDAISPCERSVTCSLLYKQFNPSAANLYPKTGSAY